MSTLKICLRLKTPGIERNSLSQYQQCLDKFDKFREVFDNGANPVYWIEFAKETCVLAIAVFYALYQEKLAPVQVSHNTDLESTIIVKIMNGKLSLSLHELQQKLKEDVLDMAKKCDTELGFFKDLDFIVMDFERNKANPGSDITRYSGEPSQEEEFCHKIADKLGLHNKNRVFLACQKCCNLKPPIVVQQNEGGNYCNWCETSSQILLHEERYKVYDTKFTEYSVVREYNSNSVVELCKNNLSVCTEKNNCRNAHSHMEKRIWHFLKDTKQRWDEMTYNLNKYFHNGETTAGVFHCSLCSENFTTGAFFSDHCNSSQHKQLNQKFGQKLFDVNIPKWRHRTPSNWEQEKYHLCLQCNNDLCKDAHSEEELEEWNKRIQFTKEKKKFLTINQLSFANKISQEFDEVRSGAIVLTKLLNKVECIVRPIASQLQTCSTKDTVKWKIQITCKDNQNMLFHVALLQRDGKKNFDFRKVTKRQKGTYGFSMDSFNCNNGLTKFEVRFIAKKSGSFNDVLVFEFSKTPRPALMVKLQVLVTDTNTAQLNILKPSDHNVWAKRKIIEFPVEHQNEFECSLAKLACKYKQPEESLDYMDIGKYFEPQNLTADNYVEEMHLFLYREEAAMAQSISRVYDACEINLSCQYTLTTGHQYFIDERNGFYGKFQLPSDLTQDTDEGLLVIENCKMVLLSQTSNKSRSNNEVYESKIETVTGDYVVITISKSCVEAWNLQRKKVVQCDLLFQLDRKLFCVCHSVLDQLPDLGRLSMLCPDINSFIPRDFPSVDPESTKSLDVDQKRVLGHLMSNEPGQPSFAVTGPFGTGKTYTISQCALYLLKNCPGTKILICTHSNSAADLFVRNNFTADEWEGKVIRVYYHDRHFNSVHPEVGRFCLFNKERNKFRYPTIKEILSQKVQVVITTFVTAFALGRITTGLICLNFTHIFLDESAQAMECEAIIPLTLASTNTKVVVAGDHMQISKKIFTNDFKSYYTLVERLHMAYNNFPEKLRKTVHVSLTNNYRCVKQILKLTQNLFYKPRLLNCCTNERPLPRIPPVQFFDTKGECVRDDGGFYNLNEAKLSVEIVQNLLSFCKGSLQESDIVVVSCYSSQVKHIRKLMRSNRKHGIQVQRVRNVQGLEFKVVVISSVHCKTFVGDTTGSKSGLLADVKLLTTAITRAKLAVIAIGDADTICSIGLCRLRWDGFVTTCQRRCSIMGESYKPKGSYFFAFSENIDDALHQSDEELSHDSDSDGADEYSPELEDYSALVEDETLSDILQTKWGKTPESFIVKVNSSGIEDVEEWNDEQHREVIYTSLEKPDLEMKLRDHPNSFKLCRINMINGYSAEAFLENPEGELRKIYFESRKKMGQSFDKDIVVIKINQSADGHVSGQVVGIYARHKEPRTREFICLPDRNNSKLMCPVDRKVTKFVIFSEPDTGPNKICIYHLTQRDGLSCSGYKTIDPHAYVSGDGKLFIVRFIKWTKNCLYPLGYVSRVMSAADAESYYAITHDRPPKHKKSLDEESLKLRDDNDVEREDYTDLYTFTIDKPRSRALDDALNIKKCSKHDNCYEIGVHIADVASMVPLNSAIDREARHRGKTFYTPDIKDKSRQADHSEPSQMLPPNLCYDKCSLLPKETRPVISTFFHTSQQLYVFDPKTNSYVFGKGGIPEPRLAKIRSKLRLSYKETEDLLREGRKDPQKYESFDSTLPQQMYQIWLYVMKLRISRLGTSAFRDQADLPKHDEAFAQMLVKEMMNTLNACTAIFLKNKGGDFLLRCQDVPIQEAWTNWIETYRSQIPLSLHLNSCVKHVEETERNLQTDSVTPRYLYVFPEVLQNIKTNIERDEVESALLYLSCDQLMPCVLPAGNGYVKIQRPVRIRTSSSVGRHFSPMHSHCDLRLPFYSTCSSPIRNYPDLIAQREIIRVCKRSKVVSDSKDPGIVTLDSRQDKPDLDLHRMCKQVDMRLNDEKEYRKNMIMYKTAKLFQDQEERFYQQAVITEVTDDEIRFSLIQNKVLSFAAACLKYSALVALFHGRKLIWHIRYYDLSNKSEKAHYVHPHFDRTVVPKSLVQELVTSVSTSINTRSILEDKNNKNDIKKHFRRIIKTQKKWLEVKKHDFSDQMSNKTGNGILHVRVISMTVEPGFPLLLQLNPRIEWGLLQPTVQLLCLADDLDICLTHRHDAVGTFAYDVKPAQLDGKPFDSTKQYVDAWLPIVHLDGVYNAVKEPKSITYSGVLIEWKDPGVKGKFYLDKRFCDERMIDIHEDGFICIRVKNRPSVEKDSHFTWVAHAKIAKVKKEEVRYKITFTTCDSLLSHMDRECFVYKGDTLWTIEHIQVQAPYKRMSRALHIAEEIDETEVDNPDITTMLCTERIPNILTIECQTEEVKRVVDSVGEMVKGFDYTLNPVQAEIIRTALRNKLSLIQGPPGTGKTLTGAYIVYYFREIIKKTKNDGLIMYCGPSNKAADVIAEYLLKCSLRILRVYGKLIEELDYPNPLKPNVRTKDHESSSKKLDSITLHKLIRKSPNKHHLDICKYDKMFKSSGAKVTLEDFKTYQTLINDAKNEEIKRHDVIICTCTGAAMKHLRFQKNISHCIIDEAGMCTEPETLVPVVTTKASQVVLIGDHKQLQPVIRCDRARELGMGISMFERLRSKAHIITIQYRMNEVICDFPSNHFYKGKLRPHDSLLDREIESPGVLEFPTGKHPRNTAVFAHIQSPEGNSSSKFEYGDVNSKYNKEQVNAVIKVLKWLHDMKKVSIPDIMILSPYKAQCIKISTAIKDKHSDFSNVHVGTVVTSQGSERDYVILSTVRSRKRDLIEDQPLRYWLRKHLGFITDPHQINVAITRAKKGLCIIGDRFLLEKDVETWGKLIESYEKRGSVFPFDSPEAPWN